MALAAHPMGHVGCVGHRGSGRGGSRDSGKPAKRVEVVNCSGLYFSEMIFDMENAKDQSYTQLFFQVEELLKRAGCRQEFGQVVLEPIFSDGKHDSFPSGIRIKLVKQ